MAMASTSTPSNECNRKEDDEKQNGSLNVGNSAEPPRKKKKCRTKLVQEIRISVSNFSYNSKVISN